VISFVRYTRERDDYLVVCCNFTPVPRLNYRIGVPKAGGYREILNSDAEAFGGSNMGNGGFATAGLPACHGRPASMSITLPPLGVVVFKPIP